MLIVSERFIQQAIQHWALPRTQASRAFKEAGC